MLPTLVMASRQLHRGDYANPAELEEIFFRWSAASLHMV
jgi:hypothetical protein